MASIDTLKAALAGVNWDVSLSWPEHILTVPAHDLYIALGGVEPPKLLPVPYYSQEASDARAYANDCGPACVHMLLDWQAAKVNLPQLIVTTNQLSSETTLNGNDVGLGNAALVTLAAKHSLALKVASGVNQAFIQDQIDAGLPVICLISYAPIQDRENQADRGGHFVVAVGYDVNNIYINDPDWWASGRYTPEMGHNFRVPWEQFNAALAAYNNTGCIVAKLFQPTKLYVVLTDMNIRSGPSVYNATVGSGVKLGSSVIVDLMQQIPDTAGNVYVPLWGGNWIALRNTQQNRIYLDVAMPAPPKPSAISGFGPHFLDGKYDAEVAKKYPVVKVMDNPGALVSAHADNPDRMFIHRRYNQDVDNVPGFIAAHGGATNAAAVWFTMYKADFEQCPWAYHEGPCESTTLTELIAFETERARIMGEAGYKPCVLNLGVGQTSDGLWRRPDMQKLMAEVVKAGGAIGLHCYAEGVMSASSGAGYWQKDGTWSLPGTPLPATIDPTQSWLALRIVRDMQIVNSLGYAPQFIATELGIDDCSNDVQSNGVYWPHGVRTRGWRTCWDIWLKEGWLVGRDAFTFYRCQLNWWVKQTGLPGCVYAQGDKTAGDPGVFDTLGLL